MRDKITHKSRKSFIDAHLWKPILGLQKQLRSVPSILYRDADGANGSDYSGSSQVCAYLGSISAVAVIILASTSARTNMCISRQTEQFHRYLNSAKDQLSIIAASISIKGYTGVCKDRELLAICLYSSFGSLAELD